ARDYANCRTCTHGCRPIADPPHAFHSKTLHHKTYPHPCKSPTTLLTSPMAASTHAVGSPTAQHDYRLSCSTIRSAVSACGATSLRRWHTRPTARLSPMIVSVSAIRHHCTSCHRIASLMTRPAFTCPRWPQHWV